MAQFDRKGRKVQVSVTCDVDHEGKFIFYDTKGIGRYPRADEESVENHMEQVFSIPYSIPNSKQLTDRNRECGFPLGRYFYHDHDRTIGHDTHLSRYFLEGVSNMLKESGFQFKIKARGICSRRHAKVSWGFYTSEFLITTEKNGTLLKLMGINSFVEAGWAHVESIMVAAEEVTRKEKEDMMEKHRLAVENLKRIEDALADGQTPAS